MEHPLFGTISGPCLDHAVTVFGVALLPDKTELYNIED